MKPIRTEAENKRCTVALEKILRKKNRTEEEGRLAELLILLIEDFEEREYAMPQNAGAPKKSPKRSKTTTNSHTPAGRRLIEGLEQALEHARGEITLPARICGGGARAKRPKVEAGSGNVFADLGLAKPDEMLVKAELVRQINRSIGGLTQAKAAELLGVSQPKVSALRRGRLADFSIGRLLRFLVALGQEVYIAVRPAKGKNVARKE